MVYITGDTHAMIDYEKLKIFFSGDCKLTKKDYLIIAGDFGGVWSEDKLDKYLGIYQALPMTVLFVDGNHENFDLLNSYPVSRWHGGKIHRIKDDIIHLMRGQVYKIEGKTFFTFGGATSIDKWLREPGTEWWPQEVPSEKEFSEAKKNLEKVGNKVDYIITHSCDESALNSPLLKRYDRIMESFPENKMLNYFERTVDYTKWFFGHYHVDGQINEKKTALYDDIVKIID